MAKSESNFRRADSKDTYLNEGTMKSFKDFLQETSIAKPKQEFKSSAGAGEDASPELVNNYKKNTPGQTPTKN